MIHKKIWQRSAILLFLLPWPGISQEAFSLDDCIAYAIKNNLNLKANMYSIRRAKESYNQSKRDLLPEISGGSGYSVYLGRSIDPNTNTYTDTQNFSNNYSLSASVGLFNAFRKWNSIAYRRILLKAEKEADRVLKYDLTFRVMNAFYQVAFNQGLLAIAREQQQLSGANYKMVQLQVKLGLKSRSDLYDVESAMALDELEMAQAKNALENAKLELIQIMNYQGNDLQLTPELKAQESFIDSPDITSIYRETLGVLPSVKQQALQLRAAQKNLAMAKSRLYPSLSFHTGFSTGYYETRKDESGNIVAFGDQFRDNASKHISLSLHIPISNKWSTRSAIRIAEFQWKENKVKLEQNKQSVYKEIQTAVQKYKALQAETVSSEKNLRAKELAHKTARRKYEEGLINIYELQLSEKMLTEAKTRHLSIRLQLNIQKKTLDLYRGVPVLRAGNPG